MKSPSILEKFNVKPGENASFACYCVFNLRETCVLREICITSSSIISRGGQLVSLNLDKIFSPLLKILLCYEVFLFGNLIFAIIARMLCGNHLNYSFLNLIVTFLVAFHQTSTLEFQNIKNDLLVHVGTGVASVKNQV